jgi:anti-anti-sigma factor
MDQLKAEQLKIESTPGSHDGIRIIRVSGPFTLQGVMDFQTVFRSGNDPVTLIDLSEVPYMDSAALGAIISVHTSSQTHGRQYALTGVPQRLRTIIEIAGVQDILVTYPSVAEAEQKLTSKK